MSQDRKQGILLASFLKAEEEDTILREVQHIADSMELTNSMIFLLQDENSPERKILTYNAVGTLTNSRLFTLRIHRKRQTNTLYTINALNKAVALDNGGETGKHLNLDWEKYSNTALLTTNKTLQVVPLKLLKIFKIEESPEEDSKN